MLEPAARSLAKGHGDAPNPPESLEGGAVADPGVDPVSPSGIELIEKDGCMVFALNTERPFETWRDQVMSLLSSDSALVETLRTTPIHLDVGEGKVDRFDLRRFAHVLSDEYSIEVNAVRCRQEAVLAYAESELKVSIQLTEPETQTAVSVQTGESVTVPEMRVDADPHEISVVSPDVFIDLPMEPKIAVPVISSEEPIESAQVADQDGEGQDTESGHGPAIHGASLQDSTISETVPDLDPVEFELDDDSLEIPPAIEPRFEEADLEPVTPVMVMETDECFAETATGPSQSGWTSRPLVRDEQGTAGERQVLVVDRTLRSGAHVSFAGDVIVYGDVNAGSKVEAEGNIVVLGTLRGHAAAGSRGDETATILALELQPTHLCIGSYRASIDPTEKESHGRLQGLLKRVRSSESGFGPEIVTVREQEICVQPYMGRLPNSKRPNRNTNMEKERMSECIVVTSGKGVKRTTANLGVALALLGKKVAVIDADIGLKPGRDSRFRKSHCVRSGTRDRR